MFLSTSLSESRRIFFRIDGQEQKLTHLVVTIRLNTELRKSQFWVPYFSISTSVTHFWHKRKWCPKLCRRSNFNFSLENVIISNLEKSTNCLLNGFRENDIKASTDKCHLLVSSEESCTAKIEDFSIKNSTEEKLG